MIIKRLLTLITVLYSVVSVSQNETLQLSLEEAVDYAIENNRNSKNAALDIEYAKSQKWETTAAGLPQINGTVDYQNQIKKPVQIFPGSTPGTYNEFTGIKQSASATATLTQLLFDGSYIVGLQSAKVYLEISKNAKDKTDLQIRQATINAYGNVLLAEESVSIYSRNIEVLQKSLNETIQIFENGLTEEESVEQLQITLKQLESGQKNALRLNEIAYKMLNITIGSDLNTTIVLKDNLESLTLQNIDLALLASSDDVQSTIDYKIAENDRRSKELLLKYERSRALPTLSAFINGGYAGYNEEFKFLDRQQDWYGSSVFGISMKIPIFSSFRFGALKEKAKINLEKSINNLNETEQQLKFQIANAKSEYQYAIEFHNTSKENLNLSESIEKKNQTKFFEGLSTSFELRQAQQQLYTIQQEYIQSMLNVITKKVALETITNQIN